jgi:uncharacterized coiled-coil protein SlyX
MNDFPRQIPKKDSERITKLMVRNAYQSERIEELEKQITALKAVLVAEKTRFGLGRKREVLEELAQEMPEIFGEDSKC